MSALPNARPRQRRKLSKKEAAQAIARLLEEHMEEAGFSEAEKTARTGAFVESVKKLKTSRSGTPSR
jgi:hypothetical protein